MSAENVSAPAPTELIKESFVNTFLMVIALIVWAISAVGLIIFVLLHSGKGTGLSDMLSGSVGPTSTGTGVIEKNLDRITIGFAVAFGLSLLVLMVVYPK